MLSDAQELQNAFGKFDLSGKTAFVTGGGTGLGYYMARGLIRAGARVMIAARREDVLAEAAKKLSSESSGKEVLYTTMDLQSWDSIYATQDHVISTLGGVDIFVGNAAQVDQQPIGSIEQESIERLLQVNVAANISLCQAFVSHMKKNRWGRVIFSSSIGSIKGDPYTGTAVYAACKGGLNAFTRVASAELAHHGITFNSLIIGLYKSVMFEDAYKMVEETQGPEAVKEFYDSFASMTARSRLGEGDELEGVVQLLASNAGSNITGTEVTVDGGMASLMKPKKIL